MMKFAKNNLLVQFASLSFVIVFGLAGVLSYVLVDELSHQMKFLEGHASLMIDLPLLIGPV